MLKVLSLTAFSQEPLCVSLIRETTSLCAPKACPEGIVDYNVYDGKLEVTEYRHCGASGELIHIMVRVIFVPCFEYHCDMTCRQVGIVAMVNAVPWKKIL